jgi:hypothetical protein
VSRMIRRTTIPSPIPTPAPILTPTPIYYIEPC